MSREQRRTRRFGPLNIDAYEAFRYSRRNDNLRPELERTASRGVKVVLKAVVRGRLDPHEFDIEVLWEGGDPLPRSFLINRAYASIRTLPSNATLMGSASQLARYVINSERHKTDDAVKFVIRGSPSPPCVHVGSNDVELDYTAGWVPAPEPAERMFWDVKLDIDADMTSSIAISKEGPTVLALRDAPRRTLPHFPSAFGHCSNAELDLTSYLVNRAMSVWLSFLPILPTQQVQIVVVNRPQSTFCYTRPGLIRIPRFVIANNRIGQIVHEAGHLWWGNMATFTRETNWLCEALAEYGLVLAEEQGSFCDYRATTTRNLHSLETRGAKAGLIELSRTPGPLAAYLLRAKGAHCLDWLRAALGDQLFATVLGSTFKIAIGSDMTTSCFIGLLRSLDISAAERLCAQWLY